MMPAPGEPAADFQVASYGKPDPEMLATQQTTKTAKFSESLEAMERHKFDKEM